MMVPKDHRMKAGRLFVNFRNQYKKGHHQKMEMVPLNTTLMMKTSFNREILQAETI